MRSSSVRAAPDIRDEYCTDSLLGAIQPETAKRPLEEMNYLFTNAPLFVPGMSKSDFYQHDLEHRVAEVEAKGSISSHAEEVRGHGQYDKS